jgi:hypothetical protein
MPSNRGVFDTDNAPTPAITYRALADSPASVVTVHVSSSSSNVAAAARVPKVMSLFRSYRCATCSR